MLMDIIVIVVYFLCFFTVFICGYRELVKEVKEYDYYYEYHTGEMLFYFICLFCASLFGFLTVPIYITILLIEKMLSVFNKMILKWIQYIKCSS